MRKTIFGVLSGLFLFLQVGCSLQPFQVVMVDGNVLKDYSKTSHRAFDELVYSKDILNIGWNHTGKISDDITPEDCYRVKYHSSSAKNRPVVVVGVLSTGKTYPVILDTGASAAIFVNDLHIQENNLEFYPFSNSSGHAMDWGMCDLGRLSIGEMCFDNWPCYYQNRHAEVRLFGLPVFRDKAVIVGLPLLRRFKYIEFDNIKGEVAFSTDGVFEPHEPNLWKRYSFVIEEDSKGNTFLLVRIPIAGEETELQLDTGNNGGIVVSTDLWDRICKKIKDTKLVEGKDLYPYIGSFLCKQGIIRKLEVGSRIIENVKISVFPDNSPVVEHCRGLLGVRSFRNTVMVLDFEKSLMWVKKPGR